MIARRSSFSQADFPKGNRGILSDKKTTRRRCSQGSPYKGENKTKGEGKLLREKKKKNPKVMEKLGKVGPSQQTRSKQGKNKGRLVSRARPRARAKKKAAGEQHGAERPVQTTR